MRKLKNSHKILSLVLLGLFLVSIIILPNSIIVDDNKVNDNTSILPSEQIDQSLDITPPQLSAPATKYGQTFSITQSVDDASSSPLIKTANSETHLHLGGNETGYLNTGIGLRWDITVPKYATITKAYINLTVANLTFGVQFGGPPFNGFDTYIYLFNEYSTNDFSDINEYLWNRPSIPSVPSYLWELNGTESLDQTIKTIDISELLQQIMALDDWDGIVGAYIKPGVGTEFFEVISFWAYDSGNPEYYPKLFIEWEGIPTFIDTPEDMYVIENNRGYSAKWQIWDDNPDKVKITCNDSILGISDIKDWTSGWFTYDLPALERDFYNFTAYFNDSDGHLIWDSLIVEAGPPKPIISSGTYKIDRNEDDAWYIPYPGAAIFNNGNLNLGGSDDIYEWQQQVICLRFNTAVPKHARITRAYVNLTVSALGGSYNGFECKIYMFYPPVWDFTDADDNDLFTRYKTKPEGDWFVEMLYYRPWSKNSVVFDLLPGLLEDETIQTPELNSSLQEMIDFANYDGYIGLYIIPTDDVEGTDDLLNIYAFPNQYRPTLFVEWEESPYFVQTPADISAKNATHGYHLDWTPADDNPTTFNIICDETVSNIPPGSTIYSGVWQSGVENFFNWFHGDMENSTTKIRYDLPPLDIGVYNFTIRVNDADSWYNLDSVIVNVTDLDLPVIDLELIQKGKEVDYFQCGNGPFTVRIYNSSIITPGVWLSAYYPGYNQRIYSDAIQSGLTFNYMPLDIYIIGDTLYPPLRYDDDSYFSYNDVLGCYEFIPPLLVKYLWKLVVWSEVGLTELYSQYESKIINNIEYNVLNRFEIRIDGDGEYIYNHTIYGGRWARPLEVWNKDLTPPIYSEPEFIEPDEPDKHYEINIWAGPEAYGAEVDSVFLYYSVDDGPWEETEMILYDGKYYGEIPAQEEGATIDYYIKITDIEGNMIVTDEYHEKAPTFEEPSIIIPIVGILLGILGALSIVAIYRHKRKVAFKKAISEKKIKKVKK